MNREELKDKCRGTLVGAAVGDALGYPLKHKTRNEISEQLGSEGAADYICLDEEKAVFSDATQMSLFTAEGLLSGIEGGAFCARDLLPYIIIAYEHWNYTQTKYRMKMGGSWLTHLKDLWTQRDPDRLNLRATQMFTLPNNPPVINRGESCGALMRVIPIGIYSGAFPQFMDLRQAGFLAAHTADTTHKCPFSTFASMALAMIVADCITHRNIDRESFRFMLIDRVFKLFHFDFPENNEFRYMFCKISNTLKYVDSSDSDNDAFDRLYTGKDHKFWGVQDSLLVAIFSVVRYIDDFEKCMRCAIGHSGESHITGTIAGGIMGAIHGYNAIPKKYLDNLELHDVLVSIADDLGGISSDEQMKERYVKHLPFNVDSSLLYEQ